jgi:uncharacterized protein YndB with AHSA1/START domain
VELHDQQVVRREVVLPVDLDAAWANLAEAEGLEGWLADEIDLDVRPGAEGTARWSDGTERHVVVDEIEVGRRLALYWWAEGEDATLVELTLDEHDDGTRLVVVEVPVRVVEAVGAGLPTGGAARGPQLAAA